MQSRSPSSESFSCGSTCRLWQFAVLVQALVEEGSHSPGGSRAALAAADAKDLVELAAGALEHEAVLGHMDNDIPGVDDLDRIEDTQEVVVRTALDEAAHTVLESLGQEDMVQQDIAPGAQDLVVVHEGEEDLAAAGAAGRHFSHLSGVQEAHESIPDCNIVQSHVPQMVGMVDAARATLQFRPSSKQSCEGPVQTDGDLHGSAEGIQRPRWAGASRRGAVDVEEDRIDKSRSMSNRFRRGRKRPLSQRGRGWNGKSTVSTRREFLQGCAIKGSDRMKIGEVGIEGSRR